MIFGRLSAWVQQKVVFVRPQLQPQHAAAILDGRFEVSLVEAARPRHPRLVVALVVVIVVAAVVLVPVVEVDLLARLDVASTSEAIRIAVEGDALGMMAKEAPERGEARP